MTTSSFNFSQWQRYIESCHPQEIEMGLTRVNEVAQKANLLNFHCPVITVGGTNGKGSTVATLSYLLQTAGLNVGTYLSPHLFDFKERIQINGQSFAEGVYCKAFEKIERYRGDVPLTFFEFTTLAAFELFLQSPVKLDVVILEVGLGGRLDAVNLINPTLSIVTSIGLDHQFYLGDTLESIAAEKAGIFRARCPAIIGKTAKISTLLSCAKDLDVTLFIEGEHFDYEGSQWQFGNKANIIPKHYLPPNSVSLAMAAYTILGEHYFSLPSLAQVVLSLEEMVMVGRCYPVFLNNTQVIFDVGHNPDGSQWLAHNLEKKAIQGQVIAVWASMADKDLAGIVKPMIALVNQWYIGQISNNTRCAKSNVLKETLLTQKVQNIHAYDTLLEAFEQAKMSANEQDLIVVFGSFYTVSQIMQSNIAQIDMNNVGVVKCPQNYPRENAVVISEY
ncbi:MAG: bifunctional tetrahydrofolate synthase/dihydrofolate synthase [Proteobacteria bacterium]|nr:bifunctional tetrahydrofolate synthase/dihydrofolate synthase [Pseudomonadota bacterium]